MNERVLRGGTDNTLSAYGESVVGPGQKIDTAPVARRRFPYPYRAGLAICSDIGGTPIGRGPILLPAVKPHQYLVARRWEGEIT